MSMCTPEHSPICDLASILTFSVSKKKTSTKVQHPPDPQLSNGRTTSTVPRSTDQTTHIFAG